ncbi:MAG: hypothetical protein E3K37_05385 [Candidatus Kuenenia sp.]|nr:hypothetical protein [Candidatus Kuenenia hertensis]
MQITQEDRERSNRFRFLRKCIERKLELYGPGIDYGLKERFVDFGKNTILVILKKNTINVTRTTRYDEIEGMKNIAWLKEMVDAFESIPDFL